MFDMLLRALLALVRPHTRSESGQSTAEYALVMIAAAAIAGLVVMWAHKTNIVSSLFNTVIHHILPF